MKRIVAIAALLAAQLFPAPSTQAQVDPVVRVQVEAAEVRVGEALSLRVTVLVPTFFPRPPVYPDFEVANAITRLPPDSSFPTSERIDGESWSGIVREYRIYPLAAATYRIDGETMRVTYANPGAEPVVRDVTVPGFTFQGTVPPGAEGLDPYVAGSALALSLDVEGNDGELAVGDAVVLTYRAVLQGLPSLFLPELFEGVGTIAGADAVTVYADAPRFNDDDGIATRMERVTLVFNAGGTVNVPAVSLDYWNTTDGRVVTASTEPLLLSIAGPPPEDPADGTTEEGRSRWPLALLAGVLLLGLVAALRGGRPVLRERLLRWRASEAYAFRQLRRNLRAGEEARAYGELQRWLERLEPGLGPRAFARKSGDDALRADIDALSEHTFGGVQAAVDLRGLEARLTAARRRYRMRSRVRADARLAPLNP